jgi:hypothetical protein
MYVTCQCGQGGAAAATSDTTMLCSGCGLWKDANSFSNSQSRGPNKKCADCASRASSALLYRCLYCNDDHHEDTNPTSKFPRDMREGPYGPCCSRGECIFEYNKRRTGGDEARKKAAQLEKEAAAAKEKAAEAAEMQAALQASLALKEQEMEGKDRALREAQEKESSLSAVAQNAKAELEMQLKELESKFASESHEWEARQAAFKAEKSKLTQDIGKVTQERDGIKKQNADLQEQAARVQAEAEVARERARVAETRREEAEQKGLCLLCWAEPRGVFFLPCSHVIACNGCSDGLRECPECKQDIRERKAFHLVQTVTDDAVSALGAVTGLS